jgi:hypothetical protein
MTVFSRIKPKHSNLIQNLSVLLITLALIWIIGEILVRVLSPSELRSQFLCKPDSLLGYSLLPDTQSLLVSNDTSFMVNTNHAGMRDYEYPLEKDSTTYRIMVLGDSFAFGWGVEMDETFPKLLERTLNGAKPLPGIRKYEVINTGVYGYGTRQEDLYYKERGYLYHPDLVILSFFKNDIEDSRRNLQSMYWKSLFSDYFKLFAYLRYKQKFFIKNRRLPLEPIYQDPYFPEFKKDFDDTLALVKDIDQEVTRQKSQFLVLEIPSEIVVNPEAVIKKKYDIPWSPDLVSRNIMKPSRILNDYFQKEQIPFYSLNSSFIKESNQPLYFQKDHHWTPLGHRLAATSIYDYLHTQGPLKSKSETIIKPLKNNRKRL